MNRSRATLVIVVGALCTAILGVGLFFGGVRRDVPDSAIRAVNSTFEVVDKAHIGYPVGGTDETREFLVPATSTADLTLALTQSGWLLDDDPNGISGRGYDNTHLQVLTWAEYDQGVDTSDDRLNLPSDSPRDWLVIRLTVLSRF